MPDDKKDIKPKDDLNDRLSRNFETIQRRIDIFTNEKRSLDKYLEREDVQEKDEDGVTFEGILSAVPAAIGRVGSMVSKDTGGIIERGIYNLLSNIYYGEMGDHIFEMGEKGITERVLDDATYNKMVYGVDHPNVALLKEALKIKDPYERKHRLDKLDLSDYGSFGFMANHFENLFGMIPLVSYKAAKEEYKRTGMPYASSYEREYQGSNKAYKAVSNLSLNTLPSVGALMLEGMLIQPIAGAVGAKAGSIAFSGAKAIKSAKTIKALNNYAEGMSFMNHAKTTSLLTNMGLSAIMSIKTAQYSGEMSYDEIRIQQIGERLGNVEETLRNDPNVIARIEREASEDAYKKSREIAKQSFYLNTAFNTALFQFTSLATYTNPVARQTINYVKKNIGKSTEEILKGIEKANKEKVFLFIPNFNNRFLSAATKHVERTVKDMGIFGSMPIGTSLIDEKLRRKYGLDPKDMSEVILNQHTHEAMMDGLYFGLVMGIGKYIPRNKWYSAKTNLPDNIKDIEDLKGIKYDNFNKKFTNNAGETIHIDNNGNLVKIEVTPEGKAEVSPILDKDGKTINTKDLLDSKRLTSLEHQQEVHNYTKKSIALELALASFILL